jgi:hypothetical protein
VISSVLDILVGIALAIRVNLCFHMSFKIDFSIYVQNVIGILIGISLKM